MTQVPIFNRGGEEITSPEAWETLAPPGPGRWREGYSAEALAQAWTAGRGPEALVGLLTNQKRGQFKGLVLQKATAEAQTHFDEYGGPRNHDLLAEAGDSNGRVTIGVEGKVNETFGQTVGGYRKAALRKRKSHEPTKAPERLRGLLTALRGSDLDRSPEVERLRYQLFSAVAGTLAAAKEQGASRAVLVVHELQTTVSQEKAQLKNSGDLGDFVEIVLGLPRPDDDPWLRGPCKAKNARGQIPDDVDLWVGHFVTS